MSNEEEAKKMQLEYRKHLCMMFQNIEDVFSALDRVYYKLQEREEIKITSIMKQIYEIVTRSILFAITLSLIGISYYFYVYWNLIPRFENSNSGITFKFWKQKNWEDNEFRNAFIHFVIFHFLLLMICICLIRTVFSNPGYIHSEYYDIYSIVNFIKNYFEYIVNYKDENYKMDLNKRKTLIQDIKLILESKKVIKKAMSEFQECYFE